MVPAGTESSRSGLPSATMRMCVGADVDNARSSAGESEPMERVGSGIRFGSVAGSVTCDGSAAASACLAAR